MKRIITIDDILDTYAKVNQRGLGFISSKFNLNSEKRTKSAFNELNIQSANWWIIPRVKKRWNKLISGNENLEYEAFVVDRFLKGQKNLKMLSIGSGSCRNEINFASFENFAQITCMDISDILLSVAKKKASEKGLNNIDFITKSIYDHSFNDNEFDIILFNASLHHFKNMNNLISNKIKKTLKTKGKLIINEYVGSNRLQFPDFQIKAINQALKLIPNKYRKRYKLSFFKNKFHGSGLIRMYMADPSECVESENILPTIHDNFQTLYEASYGGNILMNALKDISHHFLEQNNETDHVLDQLFEFEDKYIANHKSDFVFGIYENA